MHIQKKKERFCKIKNRLTAAFLALAILAPSVLTPSIAADVPAKPGVTIMVTGVDDKYVEVGFSVQSNGALPTDINKFMAAGMVLSYDPSLLAPVEWVPNEDGTDKLIPISTRGATATTAETWDVATVLQTKGDDKLSGKTALAFTKANATAKEVGYLYLSAESAKLMDSFTQILPENAKTTETANKIPVYAPIAEVKAAMPQAAVAKFAIQGLTGTTEENAAKITAALACIDLAVDPGEADATNSIAESSPVGSETAVAYFAGADGTSTEPEIVMLRTNKAPSYFSGGGSQSGYSAVINLMGGVLSWIEDGKEDPIINPYASPITTDTATGKIVIPQIPIEVKLINGESKFLGFTDGTQDGTVANPYIQPGGEYTLPGYSVGLAAVWAAKGSPAQFRNITLLDWNEVVIGTVVINFEASGADIKSAVDSVAATLYNGDLAAVEGEKYLENETWTANNPLPAILTAKKGYNFMGWADTTADNMAATWTAYSTSAEYEAAKSAVLLAATAPEGGWGNLYLKAGYVENAMCNAIGSTIAPAARVYHTISDFEFNRYGAASVTLTNGVLTKESGDYSIKMKVRRENGDNYGVTRLKKPYVRVYYTIGDGTMAVGMFNYTTMSGSDEQVVEVIVPRGASKFVIAIVDSAQVLANGRIISSYTLANMVSKPTDMGRNDYLMQATLNYLNEKAESHNTALPTAIDSDWASNVSDADFYDLGLYNAEIKQYYYQYGKPDDLVTTNATQLRNIAKNKITLYMLGKGNRDLTIEEIKEAIGMGTGAASNDRVPAAVNTNIKTAYGNVLKALESNANANLTAAQIAYAINNKGALLKQ